MLYSLYARLPVILGLVVFVSSVSWAQIGAPPSVTAPPAQSLEDTVIKVNEEEILESDVMDEIDRILRELQSQQRLNPLHLQMKNALFFEEAVERCIRRALALQSAKSEGMEIPEEDVDIQIASIRQSFDSDEQLEQALTQQGMSIEKLREFIGEELLLVKIIDEKIGDIDVPSDDVVQTFYDENLGEFEQPEMVRASHILLRFEQGADDDAKATKRAQLEAIRDEIESGDVTFEQAAMTHSQDPGSAVQGGDLDFFEKGRMVPPFAEAAFSTPVGEMSDIVETQFGYHLIQVTDKRESRTIPLDEVKEDIVSYLQAREFRNKQQAYFNALKAEAEIEEVMNEEQWLARHAPQQPQGGAGQPPRVQINPQN